MLVMVDMGIGNIQSVFKAFERIGARLKIAACASDIEQAEAVILPGVGAFGDGISSLKAKKFVEPLREHALKKGKPILGICLGMQLLAEESSEHGMNKGLGIIKGKVLRLDPTVPGYRVPNMGWCDVRIAKDGVLFSRANDNSSFYFAHSYYLECPEPSCVAAVIEYSGRQVTVAIEHKNIFGVQFHPEKSQDAGLDLLESFVKHINKENQ